LPAASAFGFISSTSIMANGLLALLNDCGVAIVGGMVFGVVTRDARRRDGRQRGEGKK
jgi:hypothetical protein